MKFNKFSKKQLTLLTWWCKNSKFNNYDAVICDGAVRSGKTSCMSLSFVLWTFSKLNNHSFAICGKTITSLRRNVIVPLVTTLNQLGFECIQKNSQNFMEVKYGNKTNKFYFFGGKDESSASLIQGITLSGVMLDEVALMPRSFVEQALARCSVEGSKFWFNCNPEHPFHWFYLEWIKKSQQKNALYLHFKMEDNPSLSKNIIKRYSSLYSGAFYKRFVLGEWVVASGLIYTMFEPCKHIVDNVNFNFEKYYISCDYGTVNPTSMGLWGLYNNKWYRIKEFYYDSKKFNKQKTDQEYYSHLLELSYGLDIEAVIIDPSAASFIQCIRNHGKLQVVKANNDVLTGIRYVSDLLHSDKLKFHSSCLDSIREFSLYVWDNSSEKDCPKKQFDHAMDDIRYFVSTVLAKKELDDFFVLSTTRK